MTLNGKYVDKDFIINELYRQYEIRIDESDLHELMWQAMSLIAIPNSFIDAVAVIDIEDMKGRLPENFYQMYNGGVREFYSRIPMRKSTDVYHTDPKDTRILSVSYAEIIGTTTDIDGSTEDTVLLNSSEMSDSVSEYTYKINNYYIFTNFNSGKVEIVYKAFPLDDNGYPLVPDDVKFIRAVVDHIAERYFFKLYLQDKISERKYEKIAQLYYFSIASVQSYARTPSPDEMENIRQRATMLLKNSEQHITGFKYLNT